MKTYKTILLLAILSLFLLTLVGCNKQFSSKKPRKIKEVRTNFIYSPFTLDPRKSTDPVSNALHFMLYEGLTRLEPDGTLSFALADSIEISKNRRVYTFYLRESYWSDGTPLTAKDFVASWKALLSPDFPSLTAHLLFPIKNAAQAKKGLCSLKEVGIYAPDESTLIVELERPTPYFMELTAYATFFPVPNGGKEVELPKKGSPKLVSNGPFELASWKNDDEIVVRRNDAFWNAKAVKIDLLRMTMIADEGTALKLFEKGDLDWIGGLISPLPLDAVSSLSLIEEIQMRPIAGTNFCAFNTTLSPFNNVHIRKAFSYAINRQLIIDNVTQMLDEVATGPVPSVLKGYVESRFFTDANKEEAQKEFALGLKELGIKKENFPKLTYSFFSSELQKKLALALQSQWREVLGVEVSLEASELKVFLDKLRQRHFDFAQMSWVAQFYDRMSFLERFLEKDSYRNYSAWENIRFQELIRSSFSVISPEKRARILEQAEQLIAEEMPIAPLYHYNALYLKNPNLKNAQISPLGHVDFRYSDMILK
ncbi:peptide ABC transporter substrate-binding protein [Simkania negevensis]|uniref:Oligopeptide-binding protein oppA n=1 Tax=Simkania negevensis (strain ATCC VR-1471 / DSM 27360 / Z) TaxID=331113 RepID=F8L841_SIMNZ|nr:peptide ABC transporter substrate-binding protein [Simkania negevensis]CCB88948.1 oligopeptide-binding protein oppA [Simkania negevensis Z]